jgi:hypothetical protein
MKMTTQMESFGFLIFGFPEKIIGKKRFFSRKTGGLTAF